VFVVPHDAFRDALAERPDTEAVARGKLQDDARSGLAYRSMTCPVAATATNVDGLYSESWRDRPARRKSSEARIDRRLPACAVEPLIHSDSIFLFPERQ
jgi:hypothetical protein